MKVDQVRVYVVAYSYPRLSRAWITTRYRARSAEDALVQCCMDYPTASIHTAHEEQELQLMPKESQ